MNAGLKRKASRELGSDSSKRSMSEQSSPSPSPSLKRKASLELQSSSFKRLEIDFGGKKGDLAGGSLMPSGSPVSAESPISPAPLAISDMVPVFSAPGIIHTPLIIPALPSAIPALPIITAPPVSPLGALGAVPTEILYEILSWSSDQPSETKNSLYALTRVSKAMAVLALPQYIRANEGILPKIGQFHIYMGKDAFYIFPAWVRSDSFDSREDLICDFTLPDIARKIEAVDIGLNSLGPALRPRSLTLSGDLNFTQGVALLDVAGRTRASSIDLEIFYLDFSDCEAIKKCKVHKLTQAVELRIDWPSLSSKQWRSLLRAISAPKLQELTLGGNVPWTALASFLSRHPTITKLRLPAVNRVTQKHSAFKLPELFSLQGNMTLVIPFIKLLSRSPNLSIEGNMPSDLSLVDTVHNIVASLVACESDVSLVSNLTSTKVNGKLTKSRSFSISTLKKWRQFPDRLARLIRLRLNIAGIEDSVLLCHCKQILSVFPTLRHVTLRRNSMASGWEWARITRDVGMSIIWDSLESSDYLDGIDHYRML